MTSRPLDVDGPAAPPRHNGELAFSEPWESRAFGLAMALDAAGVIAWEDFRRQLIATIGVWEDANGAHSSSWSYWRCWTDALEQLLLDRGVIGPDDVAVRGGQLSARHPGHDHR